MDTLNKKSAVTESYSPFEVLQPLEVLEEKVRELEARVKKLSDICTELNPYAPITDDLKMRLMDFHILDLSDPFKVTNTLLMLLEDTIDELHIIKPFNEQESLLKEIL